MLKIQTVNSIAFREPDSGQYELVIVSNGKETVYSLTDAQIRLLAFRTVSALTKC